MPKTKQTINCKNCSSTNIVKRGFSKNKLQTIQKYQCKNCSNIFTLAETKGKTYPLNVILKSISIYNLGNSLEKTEEAINKKCSLNISIKTISNWLNEYKQICTYNKLRQESIKLYNPKNIIFKQTLHHIQPYTFQYHRAKLYLLFHDIRYNNQFTNIPKYYESIKNHLEKISTDRFPHHIFKEHNSSNLEVANKNLL